MALSGWLYAAACVILPTMWGVAMVWAIERVERFVRARRPSASPDENWDSFRSPDYHI
jgi:hypothetical protein